MCMNTQPIDQKKLAYAMDLTTSSIHQLKTQAKLQLEISQKQALEVFKIDLRQVVGNNMSEIDTANRRMHAEQAALAIGIHRTLTSVISHFTVIADALAMSSNLLDGSSQHDTSSCPICAGLKPTGKFKTGPMEKAPFLPFRVQIELPQSSTVCLGDFGTIEMARAAACGNPHAQILERET